MRVRADPEKRFERLYMPEPMSGCWIWTGRISRLGYSRFGSRCTRRFWTSKFGSKKRHEKFPPTLFATMVFFIEPDCVVGVRRRSS